MRVIGENSAYRRAYNAGYWLWHRAQIGAGDVKKGEVIYTGPTPPNFTAMARAIDDAGNPDMDAEIVEGKIIIYKIHG